MTSATRYDIEMSSVRFRHFHNTIYYIRQQYRGKTRRECEWASYDPAKRSQGRTV